jgi:hydrogenase-4 component B
MITALLLISVLVIGASGVPGVVTPFPTKKSPAAEAASPGEWIGTALNLMGSALGGGALIFHYLRPDLAGSVEWRWGLPLGRFAVGMDDVSALFLAPVLFISGLGSVYGLGYWKQCEHPRNARRLRLCWGLLSAGMMLVVLARDSVLLLMAWEVMALAAFFLVTTEEQKKEVREAGWVYLVATHVGTLCLFGFFALLHRVNGTFAIWPLLPQEVGSGMTAALFVLGVVGFGLKAGIMPLHVWLPGAHANAPSHVSAMLSGVMLKMGVYGIVRVGELLALPPGWWGATLLIAGMISAVGGIAFATGQRDFKRLLAYSSIENVGIIVMGIGLALVGRSLGRADLVVLGIGGALLHVLNHSLLKPLLFMGAGAVLHAARTREMDLLGGLGKRMPKTAGLFLVGTVAICGLPPLNGFVSELLIYVGLFRVASTQSAGSWIWMAAGAPVLALVGAMALVAFVKLFGAIFSGAPRSARARRAHDPGAAMLGPMGLLAVGCVAIGVLPWAVIGFVNRAVAEWAPHSGEVAQYVSLGWVTGMSTGLVVLVGLGTWGIWWLRSIRPSKGGVTWDCGYARPTARMQYSGSSFSEALVGLLGWVLFPRRRPPRIDGVFPNESAFESEVPDVVLDRGVTPALGGAAWLMSHARVLQRGPIQVYLVYVLVILLVLLVFA